MWRRHLKQTLGSWGFQVGGLLWRCFHRRPSPAQEVKTLLILNLLKIGDTIVTLPTLEALRKLYPQATITLVVRSLTQSLVSHLSFVDQFIFHSGDNSLSSCQELIQKLPAADLAVVLDTSPWVSWAAAKAGSKRIVAYDSLHRAFAATDRVKAPPMWNVAVPDYLPDWRPPYQGQAWFELASYLGAPSEKAIPQWPVSQEAAQRVDQWLASNNLDQFILIHPGSDPSYRWPEERFRQVIEQTNQKVVVAGATFERGLCERLAKGFSQVTVWSDQGTLADYGALIARAQHVLSVDTSAAHLAAALNTPLTVLFGPGDPAIWGPRGLGKINIIQAQSECLGCKAAHCRLSQHECMESIEVERVMQALKDSGL